MVSGHAAQGFGQGLSTPGGLTVRGLSCFLLWLALASSSFVLFEPAPFDALMAGLLILLPLAGLASLNKRLLLYFSLWMVIGAAGFVASTQSGDMSTSIKHTVISVFLTLGSILIAATIRNDPQNHARLVMSGLFVAMVLSAFLGAFGYLNLIPGGYELLTKFDRAKAAFKDPNVYGAFLVPAIIYALHSMATARAGRALVHAAIGAVVCLGVLVSFSRGAWFQAVLAILLYAGVAFLASQTDRFRLKLFVLGAFGLAAMALGLVALLQIDTVAELFKHRASLSMGYDSGSQGRFGGQLKSLGVIAEHPLGIGALEFSRSFHSEDVHNVYLSMFLNAGWVGGFLYLAIVVSTVATGLVHSLKKTEHQGLMIVMFASFTALAAEGMIIDSDHWRHFYILMGIVWGLAAANDRMRYATPSPIRNQSIPVERRFRLVRNGRSGRI